MDTNVYSRLREERVRLNLSQADVASAVDMSVKQVGRWETSIAIPSDKLEVLSRIGFNVNYVVTGEREPTPAQYYSESEAENAFQALLRDADKIKAVNIYDKDTYNMLVMMFMRQLRQSAGRVVERETSVDNAIKKA
ncbi:helix-turn-helix domain-containing protein [Rheinheimera gaetbuli]